MNFSNGENLIFLISQPRSGSTLLQLMLSGSPEIATTSEPWIALHPIFALHDGAIDPQYGANVAKRALLDFLKESGAGIDFYKEQISSLLRALYNQAIRHQGKRYFLDKTPRYYTIIDDLHELFPGAKFLILFRNPLAILSSVLNTWVKDDYSLLVNNFDDLMIAPHKLVKFFNGHQNRCIKIQYEELVLKPEIIMKEICLFLGIQYSENMIEYGGRLNAEWKFGDQVGIRTSTRPNIEAVDKWNDGFKQPQDKLLACSYIESLGEKLIKNMGYDYNELKSSTSLPSSDSMENIPSWSTVINVIDSISNVRDVRRAAFRALYEEGRLPENSDSINVDWSDVFKKIINNMIRPKVEQLMGEINEFKNENSALKLKTNRLNDEIDTMRNTLSWRISAPLRNSRLLKMIFTKFRNVK
jgi:hypothetical protein